MFALGRKSQSQTKWVRFMKLTLKHDGYSESARIVDLESGEELEAVESYSLQCATTMGGYERLTLTVVVPVSPDYSY